MVSLKVIQNPTQLTYCLTKIANRLSAVSTDTKFLKTTTLMKKKDKQIWRLKTLLRCSSVVYNQLIAFRSFAVLGWELMALSACIYKHTFISLYRLKKMVMTKTFKYFSIRNSKLFTF